MKNVHEVEIKIEGKEWSDILDKTFEKKVKDIKVDGFRKGSVPKDVYIKKFGIESLYGEAVDIALQVAYKKVISDNKLLPVCEPSVDIKTINKNEVILSFKIITKPDVKLGEYKNLKVKKEKAKVSAEEVNAEIESLRNKYAEIVVKEEGSLNDKDTAVIDFEGFVDGKALEGGSGKNYPLEIGSNTFIPGFEEKLIGMKIGDEKEINLKFPSNYVENLKDKDVTFKVKLNSIKERILPELKKEFFEDLGYENVKDEESLREEVKNNIMARKDIDLENAYVDACLEKAASNMKVELNEEIIHEEIHRMLHQYEDQLKMQGLSLEQYLEFTKSSMEDLEKNMEPEALKRVKYRYLLEAIADKEQFEITDKETKEEAKKMAEQYNMTEADLIAQIGGLEMVTYDLKMRKAIEIIKK